MAQLKGVENFVAESLETFYLKSSKEVSFEEGDDPPDIYLYLDSKKIAIEITELDQNVLNNRKTIDYGYLNFIDNLNKEYSDKFDENINLSIMFYHNNIKVSKINKQFKKYFISLIKDKKLNENSIIEDEINGVTFKIEGFKRLKNKLHGIAGETMPFGGKTNKSRDINTVINQILDCNLSVQTEGIIINRINDKTSKCKNIKEPIWLALYDNYYTKFTYFHDNEHIKHYQDTFKKIKSFGMFERILVIFENGDVLEFNT
jgi:hypothetical protein